MASGMALSEAALTSTAFSVAKTKSQKVKTTRDHTCLHQAALRGHLERCSLLLQQPGTPMLVSFQDCNGWTALHHAAFWGRLEICRLLLRHATEPSSSLLHLQSLDGWTPLHCAAFWGRLQVCRLLVQSGADVQAVDHQGKTPMQLTFNADVRQLFDQTLKDQALRQAVSDGDGDKCCALLDQGIALESTDPTTGWTALHLAACHGHLEICRMLLQKGACVEAVTHDGATARQLAESHPEVRRLIEEYLDSLDWFLECVVDGKRLDLVSRLCDKYLQARNSSGQSVVQIATMHNRLPAIKTLVFRGASVNDRDDQGISALHVAVSQGFLEIVRFLVAHGAQMDLLDGEGHAPVHLAVLKGHTEVLRELVVSGATLSQPSEDGNTVFHFAAIRNKCEIMEILLDEIPGLVGLLNKEGWSPLHTASFHGSASILPQLLEKALPDDSGIDVNAPTERNKTVLHLAAQRPFVNVKFHCVEEGFTEEGTEAIGSERVVAAAEGNYVRIVLQMLDAGAGIDLCDENGETALMIASRDGKEAIVRVLLQHGARVDIQSTSGDTAVTVAATESIRSVLEIYQASQHYRDRSVALLTNFHLEVTLSDLQELVPLITSVYDLRSFMLLTQMTNEQGVSATATLECAFQQILDKKLVLDDEACVFFKLVLQDCLDKKVLSIKDQLLWDRRAEKVNTESAGWVLELKRQVFENSMRLDSHDECLQQVVNGMHQLHTAVMENREAIKGIFSRVSSLQAQVNEGKQVMKQLMQVGHSLSSQVRQLQDRVAHGKQNLVAVASSLHEFRTCYVQRLEQEKKNARMKKIMGVVASVCGFVFAPLLKEVFNSMVDFSNPLEIFHLTYKGEDIISFVTQQARDKVLEPGVQLALEKAMIKPEEFETALRGEIVLRHPELLGEADSECIHSLQLEYADPDEIKQIQSAIPAIEDDLNSVLSTLRSLSVENEVASQPVSQASAAKESKLAIEHLQPPDTATTSTEPCQAASDIRKDPGTKMKALEDAECTEFLDDIHVFPYHNAVRQSNGRLDAFCDLVQAINVRGVDDQNAELRIQLISKVSCEEELNAAEYAYYLGYRAVGDFLAKRISDPCHAPIDASTLSVELLDPVDSHPFFYCVHETRGHLNDCKELLEFAVEEDGDPIDLRLPVRLVCCERRDVAWTAVEYASHLGYMEIVKFLIKIVGVETSVSPIVLLRRTQQQARIQAER